MKKKTAERQARKEKQMFLNQVQNQPIVGIDWSSDEHDIHRTVMWLHSYARRTLETVSYESSPSNDVETPKRKTSIFRKVADIFMGRTSHAKSENPSLS